MNLIKSDPSLLTYFEEILLKVKPKNELVDIFGLNDPLQCFCSTYLHKNLDIPLLLVVHDQLQLQAFNSYFSFFDPKLKIYTYPDLDVLPYEDSAVNPKLMALRLNSLRSLAAEESQIIIVQASALMSRTLPKKYLDYAIWGIKKGQSIKREVWQKRLLSLGYSYADKVELAGEFCIKGDRIDIFSANYEKPLRILSFDDEIESIKSFDGETQISISESTRDYAEIFATSELIFLEETITRAKQELSDYKAEIGSLEYNNLLSKLDSRNFIGIWRKLMPLFYGKLASFSDYLSKPGAIFLADPDALKNSSDFFAEEINREYQIAKEQNSLALPVNELFCNWQEVTKSLKKHREVKYHNPLLDNSDLSEEGRANYFSRDNNSISVTNSGHAKDDIHKVSKLEQLFIEIKKSYELGASIIFVIKNQASVDRIRGYLEILKLNFDFIEYATNEVLQKIFLPIKSSKICLVLKGDITKGYRLYSQNSVLLQWVLSERDIFGNTILQSKKRKNLSGSITGLSEIKTGDYVVHMDYGIGRYSGMSSFSTDGNTTECLVLNYHGNDKIYVPVDNLGVIKKYSSSEGNTPSLHKLGELKWKIQKTKVSKAIEDIAKDLVELYAKRKAFKGVSFRGNEEILADFCAEFPYTETDTQAQTIEDVLADLDSDIPMDRLVCGDVGFGKTEVAMRATLKVASFGYQVAMIVPTTILAEQHFLSFNRRFKNFPYKIAHLSRFVEPAEIKEVIRKLSSGDLDIVIGTHRLFSKDVNFKKLGLLIIDEEHRFGVKQKERIRKFRSQVDTLSLSATPIPRSLHMSLSGINDISLISTPPLDRQKIKTRVLKFDKTLIKELINREIRRGGQIYFIHNRVDNISDIQAQLQKLMPEVNIQVAHGQMPKDALEKVMAGYVAKEFDVLLASTIVESGLDIPNANTLIVNNADRFGLAQLYQLRGRVGRSFRQAYACFLVDPDKVLNKNAEKRLEVLQEFSDLGAGFKIATYDLEIRGAGNFLGQEQSGNLTLVGVEAYLDMLNEKVIEIKNQQNSPAEENTKTSTKISDITMKIGYSAFLPENYIISTDRRLTVYRQISQCEKENELYDLELGLEDQFGELPKAAKNLIDALKLKILSAKLFVKSINIGEHYLNLSFSDKFKPDISELLKFLQANQGKLSHNQEISFKFVTNDINLKLALLKNFFSVIV